jgi:glycosyltransferase involved in cell wall biosynthesis
LKDKLRIIVFSDPNVDAYHSVTKSLSSFGKVKKVDWHYRTIPDELPYKLLKISYRVIESIYWVLRLFRECCEFQAHIILVQYAHFGGLICALVSKILRRKFVVQAVGSDLRIQSRSGLGSTILRLIFKTASGTICVSEDLENIAHDFGARNTVVIPAPLDLSGFYDSDYPRETNQLITVTRLIPIKGIAHLITALRLVNNVKLLIIGDGPERENLERLVQELGLNDDVVFLGWIDHNNLFWEYLQRSTIFVLPSLSEGCPRVLIEAMACGLPIVATRVGGIPEIIDNDVNGILVPPSDENALAEAIKKILEDTDFQKRASIKNTEISQKFDLFSVGQRTYDYLKTLNFT